MASNAGIYYTYDFMNHIIEKNSNSQVVQAQKTANYSVISGELFDLTTEEGKETMPTMKEKMKMIKLHTSTKQI